MVGDGDEWKPYAIGSDVGDTSEIIKPRIISLWKIGCLEEANGELKRGYF